MRTHLTRLRAALVLLLVGSGLLFAIGSTIERHKHHAEHPATAASSSGERGTGESGGQSGKGSESGGEKSSFGGSGSHVEKSHGERGVNILGVNTESLALTVVAVATSLLLALPVWLGRWTRLALLAVDGFGLLFAAGDGRELVHQLDESNDGLASIAAILIGLHVAVTALAAALFRRPGTASRVTVAEPRV